MVLGTGAPLVAMDLEDNFMKTTKKMLVHDVIESPSITESDINSVAFTPHPSFTHLLKDVQQERDGLMGKILKATNAEYDWAFHVKAALAKILPTPVTTGLEEELYNISQIITEPEKLLVFLPTEDPSIFYDEEIHPQHRVFSKFNVLCVKITQILNLIDLPLKEDMKNLMFFYESFINSLCEADAKKRRVLLSPKVLLRGENLTEAYRILQEIALQIISKDKYGTTHKKNDSGVRPVQSLGGVHFKFLDSSLEPSRPGLEYTIYAFARSLTPQFLIAPSLLIKLEGVSFLTPEENLTIQPIQETYETKNGLGGLEKLRHNQSFFLQASQTIGEKNLQEILWDSPRFSGSPENMGWHFLLALLTSPGDGKPDNYSVYEVEESEKDKGIVIGIDNDNFFCPILYQCEKSSHLYSGVNCFFYLLDSLMDQRLHDKVVQDFLTIDPFLVVLNWLSLLQYQNSIYQTLIDQKVLNEESFSTLGLPIRLSLGIGERIMAHITHLQRELKVNVEFTPHQLLYSIYPTVADYYKELRRCYEGRPSVAMWFVYKSYDQRFDIEVSDLKTIDRVLSMSPEDEVWKHSQKNRTNSLNDDLMKCIKSFLVYVAETKY